MQADFNERTFGEHGATITSAITTITGPFCAIQLITATVFADLTADPNSPIVGSGTGIALILPAGLTIFGKITSFKLTSGQVIAYHR